MTEINATSPRKPLRLWPGVVLAALQILFLTVVPLVASDQGIYLVLGPVACGALIMVWWLLFSRAPWIERLGAVALMIAAVAATSPLVHESVQNGMMGNMLPVFSIPVLGFALVVWAVASRGLSTGIRRGALVTTIVAACVLFTIVRTFGVSGDGIADLHWRWTPTPEDRLLARTDGQPRIAPPAPAAAAETPAARPADAPAEPAAKAPAATAAPTAPETRASAAPAPSPGTPADAPIAPAAWPGFRGPSRDGVVRDVHIDADWSRTPPVELWRRPIGPAWSSFAVRGEVVYTQEQRGEEELVAAYSLKTGEPVWQHRDTARFWESNAGAGPRGTPTLHGDRVYTHGGTGIVNALDARDGSVIWSRNSSTDTGAPILAWGFASSPLVVDDLLVVASSGRLAGYDLATGKPRWTAKTGGASYSSPHLATIDGVAQILLPNGTGIAGVAPADGAILWTYAWEGTPMLQPAQVGASDLLIASGDAMGGLGTRLITVAHEGTTWTVKERWASRGLKPYFNDFVIHKGHAFGFDGSILSCINLADGERKWKGGRYGHGQMLLLPDQDLLLVLSEEGELALVGATSDKFTEVARVPAIEGKTWNHPVLVGDIVLARNGEEMAAFRLPLASATTSSESKR